MLASSGRVFDLSLGQMLWSRRSVFLGLLLGGPVLLAAAIRIVTATTPFWHFSVNGARVSGMFLSIIILADPFLKIALRQVSG